MKKLEEFIAHNQYIQTVKEFKGRRTVYLVGGTIRDILLDIEPMDYDFAVSGSGITFARSIAHKTRGAFVLLSKKDDEARVVKDEIIFDFIGIGKNDILNDLQRRDFTINAMAVNCDTLEFFDPFEGVKHLKQKILKPTTDESLKHDPLRVLRGFRFVLELDFDLDKKFLKNAQGISLKKVAPERIGYELLKIMASPISYETLLKMNSLFFLNQIFPEAKKLIEDNFLWTHSLNTYYAIEKLIQGGFFTKFEPEFSHYFSVQKRIPLIKLAGLFHDIAKPDTFLLKNGEVHFYGHDTKGAKLVETLGYKRLKLSRNDITTLKKLVKEHMRPHLLATNVELTDRAIRRFFRDLGEDWLGAMMIAWADGYATAGKTKHLENTFTQMIELKRADDAKPKVDRLVNGYDLIAVGMKPGPAFKVILQELLDMQIETKIITKEEGLKIAQDMYKKLCVKQKQNSE